MVDHRCQNPSCEFVDRCPLRPVENTHADTPRATAYRKEFTPASTFEVDSNKIGHLTISGAIGPRSNNAVVSMLRELDRVRGVFAVFDSPGTSNKKNDPSGGFSTGFRWCRCCPSHSRLTGMQPDRGSGRSGT